ncbi:uncharacterized protein EKO05_0002878 [Ascochyta rabiei]|uniref:uncharacterized protein n=1 Tax=Didymella rabiei TaxID=5454 RepID=UPI001901F3F2|nr:uncharacterized protein EKO05_0002878 [Ascochyta rabiei]UPX12324.1 hypothetical protein EKO05_0002878 [Ascochyta rabiei]
MLLHQSLSLALVVSVASSSAAADSTCYYPNGEKNNGGACDANAEVSVCCGPTFVCLGNGLCQVGPDTRRTYGYEFYRSGCTDASFNSSSCPQICTGSGYSNDRGQGVKKCGDNSYCCGGSGDCCSNSANIFTLDAADVIATISPSYDFSTVSSTTTAPTSANATPSSEPMLVNNHHRSLAIGLGVGIGVGGFLLIALAVLYILKRKAKTKANGGYQKEEEISELDASWTPQLPEASPTAAKAGYTAPGDGVVHEIASGKTDPPIGAQEMDANTTYDWEPRNEPQPRDGGFRPEEHSEHR